MLLPAGDLRDVEVRGCTRATLSRAAAPLSLASRQAGDGSMDYQHAYGQPCWKPLCVQDPSSSPCSSGLLFAAEIINCQDGPKKNKTSKPAPSL